jgi:hypothetical protein
MIHFNKHAPPLWKSKKTFISILLFFVFSPSEFFGGSIPSAPNFTKKEIAFFKWGQANENINLKVEERQKVNSGTREATISKSFYWPRYFKMDGNDKIYFDNWNGQILVLSDEGQVIKSLDTEKTGNLFDVDGGGNLYGGYNKKNKKIGFIRTKPDGSQVIYNNFILNRVENGVAYPFHGVGNNKNEPITFYDVSNKPKTLPPSYYYLKQTKYGSLSIPTKNINDYYASNHKMITGTNIRITIPEMDGEVPYYHLFGITEDGLCYFFCGYQKKYTPPSNPWDRAYVLIFSSIGKLIEKIPVETDYFDGQILAGEMSVDIHGNFYQMLALKDGVHFIKWELNEP